MLILEERIIDTPLPSPVPSNMVVIPTDGAIQVSSATEEDLTANTPGIIDPIDPLNYLHSMLKDEPMYIKLMSTWTAEQQYMILNTVRLFKLYDIDYYNKSLELFSEKTDTLLRLLNAPFPYFFLPYTDSDVNCILDPLTSRNDFIRNVIRSIWLMRKWAGSTRGYRILFTLLSRLGAIHPTSKYAIGSIIDKSTERSYRLMESSVFDSVYTNLPNSTHVEGASSLESVVISSQKWDTSKGWDLDPIVQWDATTSQENTGAQGIALEISLDRIVKYPTANTLMFREMLGAVSTLLPLVAKAGIPIKVGTQLTLVAQPNGRYNTADSEEYTHPNILTNFQIYAKTFTNASNIRYIKTGSGRHADSEVFIPYDAIDLTPYRIPIDVANTTGSYIGNIGERELFSLDTFPFNVVHTMLHNRTINRTQIQSISILVNGKNKEDIYCVPTSLPLGNSFVTPGSVDITLDISVRRIVRYTINVVQPSDAPIIVDILGTIVQIPMFTTASDISSALTSISIKGWEVSDSSSSFVEYTALNSLSDFSSVDTVVSPFFTLIPSVINEGVNNKSIFQKVRMYETGVPSTLDFNGSFAFYQKTNSNNWVQVGEVISTDVAGYLEVGEPYSYNSQDNRAFTFLQLRKLDLYPTVTSLCQSYVNGDELADLPVPLVPGDAYSISNWIGDTEWYSTASDDLTVEKLSNKAVLTYQAPVQGVYFNIDFFPYALLGPHIVVVVYSPIPTTVTLYWGVSTDNITIPAGVSTLYTRTSVDADVPVPNIGIGIHDPVTGDSLEVRGVFFGKPSPISIRDFITENRGIVGQGIIRISGKYKQALLFEGAGSRVTLSSPFSTTVERSFSLFLRSTPLSGSPDTFNIFSHGTGGGQVSLYKDENYIHFEAPFSTQNGHWKWEIESSNMFEGEGKWITLSYSFISTSVPELYIEGTKLSAIEVVSAPSGTSPSLSSEDAIIGEDFSGTIEEFRWYTKTLSQNDITQIIEATTNRTELVTSLSGQPVYVNMNAETGEVAFKLKYNEIGVFRDRPESVQALSSLIPTTDVKYDLANLKGKSIVSEVAVFDLNDKVVAYGAFPPIEYDASTHHLSFNFMFPVSENEDYPVEEFDMALNEEPINETII